MATESGPSPPPTPERTSHPFLTYDMIYEIPEAIGRTVENSKTKIDSISQKLKDSSDFYFTGCGTAFHSALLGANTLSLAASDRLRHECVQAIELTNYHPQISKTSVGFGVSHSGITKTTTLDTLRSLKRQGAHCIGITHYPNRPITQVAEETLVVGNGPDKSRCHTKCYLSGAAALTLIGLNLLEHREKTRSEDWHSIRKDLSNIPDLASKVLRSTDETMKEFAQKHAGKQTIYFAGAGASYPNAVEAALKIMETSYAPAQGFETEQLLHGPWVSLDAESVVFVIATERRTYARSLDLVKAATRLGANVFSIVNEDNREMTAICKKTIQIPTVDEHLSPFLSIIPLYLFAYYMSLQRGYNPDYLRYLTPAYWAARQVIFPPGTH